MHKDQLVCSGTDIILCSLFIFKDQSASTVRGCPHNTTTHFWAYTDSRHRWCICSQRMGFHPEAGSHFSLLGNRKKRQAEGHRYWVRLHLILTAACTLTCSDMYACQITTLHDPKELNPSILRCFIFHCGFGDNAIMRSGQKHTITP